MIRQALQALPEDAGLQHVLGLALVRQKRLVEAVPSLQRAAEIAPERARYAYVYGVALYSAGRSAEALAVLEESYRRHPADHDILMALAMVHGQGGCGEAATA